MGVAKSFLSHIFKQFKFYNSLISNRDPHFACVFARELAYLHYYVKLSTTHHPLIDGQTEQTNQEIETYLHIFCANNPQRWMDFSFHS